MDIDLYTILPSAYSKLENQPLILLLSLILALSTISSQASKDCVWIASFFTTSSTCLSTVEEMRLRRKAVMESFDVPFNRLDPDCIDRVITPNPEALV
jgi:hypothetical protein